MPAVTITPSDLTPFADIAPAKAEAMIEDALAIAATVAPCVLDDEFTQAAAAKAIIRGAILRWHDADAGSVTTERAGQVSITRDNSVARKGMFWPSEVLALQKLCGSQRSGKAFTVDTTPPGAYPNPLAGAVINLPEVDEP